jgi:hypothetical protein
MTSYTVTIETDTTSEALSTHQTAAEAKRWADHYANDSRRAAQYTPTDNANIVVNQIDRLGYYSGDEYYITRFMLPETTPELDSLRKLKNDQQVAYLTRHSQSK